MASFRYTRPGHFLHFAIENGELEIVSFPIKNHQEILSASAVCPCPKHVTLVSLVPGEVYRKLFGKSMGFPKKENCLGVEQKPLRKMMELTSVGMKTFPTKWKKIQSCSSHHQPEKLLIIGLFINYTCQLKGRRAMHLANIVFTSSLYARLLKEAMPRLSISDISMSLSLDQLLHSDLNSIFSK